MASGGGDSCEESCEDVNLKELNESIDELSIYGRFRNNKKVNLKFPFCLVYRDKNTIFVIKQMLHF